MVDIVRHDHYSLTHPYAILLLGKHKRMWIPENHNIELSCAAESDL
jgi:hypothetical protein